MDPLPPLAAAFSRLTVYQRDSLDETPAHPHEGLIMGRPQDTSVVGQDPDAEVLPVDAGGEKDGEKDGETPGSVETNPDDEPNPDTETDPEHAEPDAEHDETLDALELKPEQQERVNKAFGRKTAAVREERTKREAAEKERDEAVAEAKRLADTVGNETILQAAQAAGVPSEIIASEHEAKAIVTLKNNTYWRDVFEAAGDTEEGWTGQVGGQTITYTPQQCRQQARNLRNQVEGDVQGRRALDRAGSKAQTLFELGVAAQKAGLTLDAIKGFKPGQRAVTPALTGKTTTTGARQPPPVPGRGGSRTPLSPRGKAVDVDWGKVASGDTDGLQAIYEKEARASFG